LGKWLDPRLKRTVQKNHLKEIFDLEARVVVIIRRDEELRTAVWKKSNEIVLGL
jgi:hypothetical protein